MECLLKGLSPSSTYFTTKPAERGAGLGQHALGEAHALGAGALVAARSGRSILMTASVANRRWRRLGSPSRCVCSTQVQSS